MFWVNKHMLKHVCPERRFICNRRVYLQSCKEAWFFSVLFFATYWSRRGQIQESTFVTHNDHWELNFHSCAQKILAWKQYLAYLKFYFYFLVIFTPNSDSSLNSKSISVRVFFIINCLNAALDKINTWWNVFLFW